MTLDDEIKFTNHLYPYTAVTWIEDNYLFVSPKDTYSISFLFLKRKCLISFRDYKNNIIDCYNVSRKNGTKIERHYKTLEGCISKK